MRIPTLAPLLLAAAAQQGSAQIIDNGAEYFPVAPGYSWLGVDAANPGNTELLADQGALSIFGKAHARVLGSSPTDGLIVHNDGATMSWLGVVDTSGAQEVVPHILFGPFQDGYRFHIRPGESAVLRLWNQLDHSLQPAGIQLSSTLQDVLVLVWYDENFAATASFNSFFESGPFGTALPYSITDVDFFQRGRGTLASAGVAASTGTVTGWFDFTPTMDCDGNGTPDYTDIAGGAPDCNRNGVPDTCDLAWGLLPDANGDGVPDPCLNPLRAIPLHLSIATGGVLHMDLYGTTAQAGHAYLLLGSVSGSSPGLPLGNLTLPLVFDPYFSYTLTSPNYPPLAASFGFLTGTLSGSHASATFALPPGANPAIAYLRVEHAALVIDTLTLTPVAVSNPSPFVIVP